MPKNKTEDGVTSFAKKKAKEAMKPSKPVTVDPKLHALEEALAKHKKKLISDADKNYSMLKSMSKEQLDEVFSDINLGAIDPKAIESVDKDAALFRVVDAAIRINKALLPEEAEKALLEYAADRRREVQEKEYRDNQFRTVFEVMFTKHGFALVEDKKLNSKNLSSLSSAALKDIHHALTLDKEAKFEHRRDILKAIMDFLSPHPWAKEKFASIKFDSIGDDDMSTTTESTAKTGKKVAAKKAAAKADAKHAKKTAPAAAKGKVAPKAAAKAAKPAKTAKPAKAARVERPDVADTAVLIRGPKNPGANIRGEIKNIIPDDNKGIKVKDLVSKACAQLKIPEDRIRRNIASMIAHEFAVVK